MYTQEFNAALAMMRNRQVVHKTGRGRSTLYTDIKAGFFVKPVKIGARAVGWPAHEVNQIVSARVAGKSDDEIRVLVEKLEAARKAAA